MNKVLVTGGAGFIGSYFIRHIISSYDWEIINLDKLTYAGNLNNLLAISNEKRYRFVRGDICDRPLVDELVEEADLVVNFAAETHVDRSIIDAGVFVKTDMMGVHSLLEACRRFDRRFAQISTDEVYGSILEGSFSEADRLSPSNPYAASKAGADLLVDSYFKTYGLDVLITRSSNNYGPYQHPEKLIPRLVINALSDRPLPLYGDGLYIRDWIHVVDNCEAIDLVIKKSKRGEIYNIGGGNEMTNLDVAKMILKELGKSEKLITFVKDRPGHDRRYSLQCDKIHSLGWKPKTPFTQGLSGTIPWYASSRWWWEPLAS